MEIKKPLIVYEDNDGEPVIVIDQRHTYSDIARHFIENDPVGAEELHRILGERL